MLRAATRIFLPTFGPERLGAEQWDTVVEEGSVVDGAPLGRGADFARCDLFTSMQDVFTNGKSWRDTSFYQNHASSIRDGKVLWRCRTEEQFLTRLEVDVRGIFDSMKRFGFLNQREVIERAQRSDIPNSDLARYASADYHSPAGSNHEIKIGINEIGEAILIDGRHRLAIARILAIPSIPVTIVVRHRIWSDFRDSLMSTKGTSPGNGVQFSHPDLSGIKLTLRGLISRSGEAGAKGILPQTLGARLGN